MTIDSTNLTNAEYFRLNGNLSNDRIESLLDLEETAESVNLDNLGTNLEEIRGSFPYDEFAEDVIYELEQLAGLLNDEQAIDLYRIIKTLEHRVISLIDEANYGISLTQDLIDKCPEEN